MVRMPMYWLARGRLTNWEETSHSGWLTWTQPNPAEPGDAFLAVESDGFHAREVIGYGHILDVGDRCWRVRLTINGYQKPPVLAMLPPPRGYGRQVIEVERRVFDELLEGAVVGLRRVG